MKHYSLLEHTSFQKVDKETGIVFVVGEEHRTDGRLHRNRSEGPAYLERDPETNEIFHELFVEDAKIIKTSGWSREVPNEDQLSKTRKPDILSLKP